jgi:hypothetical protein
MSAPRDYSRRAFAVFHPEEGIDLDSIAPGEADVIEMVAFANDQVKASHGVTPYVCRAVIVTLAEAQPAPIGAASQGDQP